MPGLKEVLGYDPFNKIQSMGSVNEGVGHRLPEVDNLAQFGVQLPGEALRNVVDARPGRASAVRGGAVHLGGAHAAAVTAADGEDDVVEPGPLLSSVSDPNLFVGKTLALDL